MRITELIHALENLKEKYGDITCVVSHEELDDVVCNARAKKLRIDTYRPDSCFPGRSPIVAWNGELVVEIS